MKKEKSLTDERMSEKEIIYQLTHELSQLKNLVDHLPGDIYWKDKDGMWAGLNRHCAQSLQRMGFIKKANEKEVIGKTDYQLFDLETADGYRQNDIEVMENKKEISREEHTQLPTGEKLILLSIKRPIYNDNNEVVGILGNTIDITYLKKIEAELKDAKEKAEAASNAKTEFLENMRHDIRTPLTGIVGFSDILRMESQDSRTREYADNLVASSHALLDLLDEVLEAIRVSSGEVPKLKKKFNLQKTLQNIIELNRAKAAQKKLQLSLDYDPKIPTYLVGDKIRLHRIALELMANALNFTDRGFVKLTAKFVQRNHHELIIKLIVEDSGIGIPKDKQQEIYVQFKRLTPSYQGIYKGAGLGLSVIKQFIDELEGEIYVESEPRKGSTFTCVFPIREALINDESGVDDDVETFVNKRVDTVYAQGLQRSRRDEKPAAYQHCVLVVEDNAIAQLVAKAILSNFNCEAHIAENGQQAIDLWQRNAYDLIFMDIGLPDMEGYEVSRSIRAQELPKKTYVPIIALTAHASEENKKRCIEAGMEAVFTKPLTAKVCTHIIESFIVQG
jgi:two-component system aerobic respiration control sensor histidine kinase ArcB